MTVGKYSGGMMMGDSSASEIRSGEEEVRVVSWCGCVSSWSEEGSIEAGGEEERVVVVVVVVVVDVVVGSSSVVVGGCSFIVAGVAASLAEARYPRRIDV